jgi:hypothetical protein
MPLSSPKANSDSLTLDVSAIERELDDAIRHLATQSALAEDRGDIGSAMELSRRMAAAIKSRTPKHVARLDAEALERLDGLTMGGNWTDEVLERSGAYFDVSPAAVRRRMR